MGSREEIEGGVEPLPALRTLADDRRDHRYTCFDSIQCATVFKHWGRLVIPLYGTLYETYKEFTQKGLLPFVSSFHRTKGTVARMLLNMTKYKP
jgi:hypothetical protein